MIMLCVFWCNASIAQTTLTRMLAIINSCCIHARRNGFTDVILKYCIISNKKKTTCIEIIWSTIEYTLIWQKIQLFYYQLWFVSKIYIFIILFLSSKQIYSRNNLLKRCISWWFLSLIWQTSVWREFIYWELHIQRFHSSVSIQL